jgi:hypothetical protein
MLDLREATVFNAEYKVYYVNAIIFSIYPAICKIHRVHKHIGKTGFFVKYLLNVFLSLAFSTTILTELFIKIFKKVCKQSTFKTFSNKNKEQKYV